MTDREPPTTDQLWSALDRQIRFGDASARAVDAGEDDEAIRIALALRVLLHDTGSSTSLLKQLGVKYDLAFLDSRPVPIITASGVDHEGNEIEIGGSPMALAHATMTDFRWRAPLEEASHQRPRLPFAEWWNQEAVAINGKAVSRFDLVNFMAHHDGGAHVDPRGLDSRYRDLSDPSRNQTGPIVMAMPDDFVLEPGTVLDLNQAQRPSGNAAAASVRQIWYELMVTMREYDEALDS